MTPRGCSIFIAVGLIALLAPRGHAAGRWAARHEAALAPAMAALLARNDVYFLAPVERAEDGIPLGNGDLGTMVWTPSDEGGLVFQLNKVDAWALDSNPALSPSSHGLVSLARLVIRPSKPLQAGLTGFTNHLALGDAMVRMQAQYPKGHCAIRTFVSAVRPLLVVELEDTRPGAGAVTAATALWRIPAANSPTSSPPYLLPLGIHAAAFAGTNDAVITQAFSNQTHTMRYAVALGAMAGGATYARPEPRSACATLTPGKGRKVVVLAAVALSFDPGEDVVAKARQELAAARAAGLERLVREHAAWWADFWNQRDTYVHLHSQDKLADYLEAFWYLALYQTASSSRGICPPKFNGSIFNADRDFRCWASGYWIWNTESMYFPLFAQNAMDLVEPFYRMYGAHLPAARLDARQLWGCGGAWYSEGCVCFEKPIEMTPAQTRAAQSSRLENPKPNYTSHIHSGGAEIAWMFYKRYDYTRDLAWLRERAYPLMKEVAAFYMDYFKKGADGRYHIYPTNGHEAWWGVRDSMMDLAACRWLMPRLIRSSATLAVDADLRSKWQEFLDNLAPYPTAETPGAQELFNFPPGTYAAGLLGTTPGRQNAEAVCCTPVWPFEDIGVGISPTHVLERMRRTLPSEMFGNPDAWAGYPGWSRTPVMAVRLGMKDLTRKLLRRSAVCGRGFPSLIGLDHEIGIVRGEVSQILSTAVNEALLQSHNGLIQLFQGWPEDCDGRFRLLAEGNLLVESEKTGGRILFVALSPRLDGQVTVLNPWPGQTVQWAAGGPSRTLQGERLVLDMKAGQDGLLSPAAAPVKAVPPLAVPPRAGLMKEYYDEALKIQCRIGLNEKDRFQYLSPVDAAVGPIVPTNAAEVNEHFLINSGWGQYGKSYVSKAPEYVPEHGGAIGLAGPAGAMSRYYCAYVAGAGQDESVYFGDMVMEADFIPDHSGLFGFFFRQVVIRSAGVYTVTLERLPKGKSRIRFGLDEPGYESVLQYVPVGVDIQDGATYHLRLSVRNVPGQSMRYADVKLDVFLDAERAQSAATGEMRLNLSADNMPDAGQGGIRVLHGYPYDDTGKPWRVAVRNFSVRPPNP